MLGDSRLKFIALPEGLERVDEKSFYRSRVREVRIPASVESVGRGAFSECWALKVVKFAEGSRLRALEADAFRDCGLESVALPARLERVGDRAFGSCSSLRTVSFAPGCRLAEVGEDAFPAGVLEELRLGNAWQLGYF